MRTRAKEFRLCPKRGKALQVYHRIEGEIVFRDIEEEGFGKGVEQEMRYQHSIFGVGVRKEIFTGPVMETWNLGMAFVNALSIAAGSASNGFTVGSSVRRVFLSDYRIESRDSAVLGVEYRGSGLYQRSA